VIGNCSQAALWEVAANGLSSTGNTVAGDLASVGVNTSNLVLTDATGVRITPDGPASQIVIVGNGVRTADGTPDIWLALLARSTPTPGAPPAPPPGITSLSEQQSSLAGLGMIGNQLLAAGDSAIASLALAPDYYRCKRPRGVPEDQTWCVFAYGFADSFDGVLDTDGEQVGGTVGLARYFSPATSVGVAVGGASLYEQLPYGGHFNAPGAMIGAYVSHRPDLGPQFLGMALVDLYPEMDVARGYPNGAGLASSSGTTQSTTSAGMARIGWALPVFGPAVAVPYAEISAVSASVDGWTESGGPFPAGIGAFNVTATTLRLGSQLRVPVSDNVTLFGSADFADLLSSSLPTVEGSLLVADCNGAAPLLGFCGITGTGAALTRDWFEASAGARFELSPTTVATISASYMGEVEGFAAYAAQVGISQAF
jgi:hypothetical protein